MKKALGLLTAVAAILALSLPVFAQPSRLSPESTYIIVFQDHLPNDRAAEALTRAYDLKPEFYYNHALKGMSAKVPAGRLKALQNDPRVAYIEADQPVELHAQETPTGIARIFADQNQNLTIDGTDDLRIDVDVAVIDTGVDLSHPDLNLYARTNCARGGPLAGKCKNNDGDDGNGHGTHVAGTIGALDNNLGVVGVAPGARIWSVRVLDNSGSGYMSWIIAGIDYVTANASQIEVANMSLGCECTSAALNTAITTSVTSGVTYVVSAGNSNKDVSTFSPANHPEVITVSALADFDGLPGGNSASTCRNDQDDTLADFSNWGSGVDITAPGVCILSTWKNGGYNTISGTSMSSPHVAGAAALLAASGDYKPVDIRNQLKSSGNLDWQDDSNDGYKERLLDVSNGGVFNPQTTSGTGNPPADNPPVSGFNLSASGYKLKGIQYADLTWSGADTTKAIDVYRNSLLIVKSLSNSGLYTDNIGNKGGGSYTYQVCETGTQTCSNLATVTF